jgi:NAD-dependent SIR2 family protein deacetylase
VDRLARLLLNGQTSLFLGAGVSIDAGLPSWSQLIELLAAELAISPPDRASLASLNPLEAASLLAARAGGDAALKRLCARIVGMAKRHSPQHALLAGLPFKGCVTRNFDELFELAVRGAGVDTAGGWAARSSNRR